MTTLSPINIRAGTVLSIYNQGQEMYLEKLYMRTLLGEIEKIIVILRTPHCHDENCNNKYADSSKAPSHHKSYHSELRK